MNRLETETTFWKTLRAGWMRFARKAGEVNTVALLFLFYYYIFSFFALGARLFGKDLLGKRIEAGVTFWNRHENPKIDLEAAQHQV